MWLKVLGKLYLFISRTLPIYLIINSIPIFFHYHLINFITSNTVWITNIRIHKYISWLPMSLNLVFNLSIFACLAKHMKQFLRWNIFGGRWEDNYERVKLRHNTGSKLQQKYTFTFMKYTPSHCWRMGLIVQKNYVGLTRFELQIPRQENRL